MTGILIRFPRRWFAARTQARVEAELAEDVALDAWFAALKASR